MKIPCKDCLILPICKHREEVRCDWLNTLATKSKITTEAWWYMVHLYLPNTRKIRNSKGAY